MTIVTLNWPADSYDRGGTLTNVAIAVADSPVKAVQSAYALRQDRVGFALCWARWEPALVAQHHREWFA